MKTTCEYIPCSNTIESVRGKVRKRFCSDKCRKAAKRAILKELELPAGLSADELRTTDTKLPTSDNSGQGVTDKALPKNVLTTNAPYSIGRNATTGNAKRGKDIKTFNDLPPDVQQTINMMSQHAGKIDLIVKANRTAIAVHYQHLYPGRYYSTGVA